MRMCECEYTGENMGEDIRTAESLLLLPSVTGTLPPEWVKSRKLLALPGRCVQCSPVPCTVTARLGGAMQGQHELLIICKNRTHLCGPSQSERQAQGHCTAVARSIAQNLCNHVTASFLMTQPKFQQSISPRSYVLSLDVKNTGSLPSVHINPEGCAHTA